MKREIICNTGPILGLAIIGRLDLFRDLFDSVFVLEERKTEDPSLAETLRNAEKKSIGV